MNDNCRNEPLTLRFHHILCLPQFIGKGYSDDFSRNMFAVKEKLEHSDDPVRFICVSDMICQNCPNKKETGCLLDKDSELKISEKDSLLAELLGKESGFISGYGAALGLAAEKISREDFERLCGKCRWYKAGVCGYEKWTAGIKSFTDQSPTRNAACGKV